MFEAWKRSVYATPPGRPIRWMFLALGLLFVIQSLLAPQPVLIVQLGVLLVGAANLVLFVAEMLRRAPQQTVGNVRMLGALSSFTGGVLLLVGMFWLF